MVRVSSPGSIIRIQPVNDIPVVPAKKEKKKKNEKDSKRVCGKGAQRELVDR
jgi:hypothetical protein